MIKTAEQIALDNVQIPADIMTELEELKIDDPDAYIEAKASALETAKSELQAKFDAAKQAEGADRLTNIVNDFKGKSGIDMTAVVIQNHIPPAIKADWEAGKITDEQFVEKAVAVLNAVKVLPNNGGAVMPNIGDAGTAGGVGDTPKDSAAEMYAQNQIIY